jgi:hypothetical protein
MEAPMCLREGEKRPFTGEVRTGDTVQIDFNVAGTRAARCDCARQTVCPFPDKRAFQNNLGPIS